MENLKSFPFLRIHARVHEKRWEIAQRRKIASWWGSFLGSLSFFIVVGKWAFHVDDDSIKFCDLIRLRARRVSEWQEEKHIHRAEGKVFGTFFDFPVKNFFCVVCRVLGAQSCSRSPLLSMPYRILHLDETSPPPHTRLIVSGEMFTWAQRRWWDRKRKTWKTFDTISLFVCFSRRARGQQCESIIVMTENPISFHGSSAIFGSFGESAHAASVRKKCSKSLYRQRTMRNNNFRKEIKHTTHNELSHHLIRALFAMIFFHLPSRFVCSIGYWVEI